MKAIFIQFFYLSWYTNETILLLPETIGLWKSSVPLTVMPRSLYPAWSRSWGFYPDFFPFSYFTAKISFRQAICNYSWAHVCTISPETASFPQPLVLPCRTCLAQNLILPWRSSKEAKVRCCDLTWLQLKSMQLFFLSSYSFNMHQGRVFHVGTVSATVLWCSE